MRDEGPMQEAFHELVKRYTPAIYNLAYRFTGDPAEAEDIVQETFLRVYRALPNSRLDLPFKPWLLRIAVNLCRDRAKGKHAIPFSALDQEEGKEGLAIEEIPDDAPLPLERLEAEEVRSLLSQAVDQLPEAYRLAITLRYNEGLSYQEIANVLGIPLNTVRTHLFRAKQLLREWLQERVTHPGSETGRGRK